MQQVNIAADHHRARAQHDTGHYLSTTGPLQAPSRDPGRDGASDSIIQPLESPSFQFVVFSHRRRRVNTRKKGGHRSQTITLMRRDLCTHEEEWGIILHFQMNLFQVDQFLNLVHKILQGEYTKQLVLGGQHKVPGHSSKTAISIFFKRHREVDSLRSCL